MDINVCNQERIYDCNIAGSVETYLMCAKLWVWSPAPFPAGPPMKKKKEGSWRPDLTK